MSELSIAYHEAAHAVAALAVFGTVQQVTIGPKEDRSRLGCSGFCTVRGARTTADDYMEWLARAWVGGDTIGPDIRKEILGAILFSLAGYGVEAMLSGDLRINSVHRMSRGAKDIVEGWALIELAVGCCSLRDAAAAFEREELRTRRFLDTHWRHVVAVADALRQHQTLNEEMVRAAIAALKPIRRPTFIRRRTGVEAWWRCKGLGGCYRDPCGSIAHRLYASDAKPAEPASLETR